MKLLCVIDSLGSGGAQRQLTTLSVGLKRRGHQVRFLVYHPDDHFLPLLQAAEIPCQVIPPCTHWRRALAVRKILRHGWQDVVLAFLEAPCLYAQLARIPDQHWGLVAGERLANPQMNSGLGRWLRQFHRLADIVVANSHTNRLLLEKEFSFLRGKLATVYNTVDLQLFHPASVAAGPAGNSTSGAVRIVVAASYQDKKNMMGVAKALLLLRQTPPVRTVVIDWYGGMPADPGPYHRAKRFISENGLADSINLYPATKSIASKYAAASAVGLFSHFEGLPNVVCEGMACGKPILLSNVCDAGNLVQDGKNGYLCDPRSAESMASAIRRVAALSQQDQRQMGLESRKKAEELFAESVVISRYERILETAAGHEPMPTDCTWPAGVPESAVNTVKQWTNGSRGTQE